MWPTTRQVSWTPYNSFAADLLMEVRRSLKAEHNDIKFIKDRPYIHMYIFSFKAECKATFELPVSV